MSVPKCECEGWPHYYLCPKYRPPKRMKRESTKQAARRRKLSALRKRAIENGLTQCQIRWEGVCTGQHEGWHHLKKRSAGGDDSETNIVLSCNACNGMVEDEPAAARRRGLIL